MFYIKIQDPRHKEHWIVILQDGRAYCFYKKLFKGIESISLAMHPLAETNMPEPELQVLVKTVNTKLVRLLFE